MIVSRVVAGIALALGMAGSTPDSGARAPDERVTAKQVCDVLHRLPAQHRQACCGVPESDLSGVCEVALDAALRRGAVHLKADRLARCRAASESAMVGCDRIGPLLPALPDACNGLLAGTRKIGSTCASSVECREGLYCQGVGDDGKGVCASPAPVNARCESPSDSLQVFTRTVGDPRHPTCDGICVKGQCLAQAPKDAACSSAVRCAAGLQCTDGRCTEAPLAALGQFCSPTAGCAGEATCQAGRCALPKAGGEACMSPFECRSLACARTGEAGPGQCVDACKVAASRPFALPVKPPGDEG
ncbi:hypothetical protein [Tahibacter amnicola]|uniref:Cysteine rich repeat protein n=1 Tax=Tahibacter amnicola TaxID=2976241 RepID=A0ABY6BKY1_9GAMM|nr:hypothetical protein [Tahibacter amnicola]UXI70078.1 hypothetical protein N4264_10755 [Tahibacter amnicola]